MAIANSSVCRGVARATAEKAPSLVLHSNMVITARSSQRWREERLTVALGPRRFPCRWSYDPAADEYTRRFPALVAPELVRLKKPAMVDRRSDPPGAPHS